MHTSAQFPQFRPHPNLAEGVNDNIVRSEIEGGVHLANLPPGTILRVETRNHQYTIVFQGLDRVLISGHPEFCPEPVAATIHGSSWGGSMLKAHFIGRGMHLEFAPGGRPTIRTSTVLDVRAHGEI